MLPSAQYLRSSSSCDRLSAAAAGVVVVRRRARRMTITGCVRPIAETVAGKVTEVDKDTFWPIVEAAGDKPVVLDMYTQWYDSSSGN